MQRGGGARGGQGRRRRRRGRQEEKQEEADHYGEVQHIRPEDQLDLTEQQKEEVIPKDLTAMDPNVPTGVVAYHFGESSFKALPSGADSEHVAFHFQMDGSLLYHKGEEAVAQLQEQRAVRAQVADRRRELEKQAIDQNKTPEELEEELGVSGGRNQFNYAERAAQTYNAGMRHRAVSTEPPLTDNFGATLTRWDIYDDYLESYEQQVAAEAAGGELVVPRSSRKAKTGEAIVHSAACGWSLKIIERMVVQNAKDELYSDFKYWEDESDALREGGVGSVLPLWRFVDQRVRKKMVTAIAWNPRYGDMFAVGYGSYEFMRQGSGLVCIYTLKNVSYPEYVFALESGVMSLDFHPDEPAMLSVGCYDGTVQVFDVRRREHKPLFSADVRSGKHSDPVWQVRWQREDEGKDQAFFSISSDGRVASWTLSKNELLMETVMSLRLVQGTGGDREGAAAASTAGGAAAAGGAGDGEGQAAAEDDGSLTGLAGGCCFDVSPFQDHLYLVGTEEGRIHKCSKAFSGQYLETYEGHHMVVYSVKWNCFHERVFASCSADWTVKIWDHLCPRAVMTFDLQNSVGDLEWSPYSSSVFAAVTSNGKAIVFDLNVNKHEQICEQKIVKKARLTHVSFARDSDIMLVGDSTGIVTSLKLSPNLRKREIPQIKYNKKGEPIGTPPSREELEIAKLNRIMTAADVKAAIPITNVTGKAEVAEGVPEEEAAAAAGAGE